MSPQTTDLPTEFGQRLRELRESAGLSQFALARKVRCSNSVILRLENGESRIPSWSTVQRLADALGVGTDDFREKKKKSLK